MGWKLIYVSSLDGARAKEGGPPGAIGTDIIGALIVEDVGAKRDELAAVAKSSEYDGGGALLSKGVGNVGDTIG